MEINTLLDNLKGEPVSYLSELFTLTADAYAAELGESHPEVVSMRRSAWAVGLMRGMDAESAWEADRRGVSWWKRLSIPKTAPAEYVNRYIAEQKQRARDAVKSLEN